MLKQVKFQDNDGTIFGGLLMDNGYLICGECGSILEPDDFTILEEYDMWVDLSDTIIGE